MSDPVSWKDRAEKAEAELATARAALSRAEGDNARLKEAITDVEDYVLCYYEHGEEQDTVANVAKAVQRLDHDRFRLKVEVARLKGERDPIYERKQEQRPTRWNQIEVDPSPPSAPATAPEHATPIARPLFCPHCGTRHIDAGEWETRPHHRHLCLNCEHTWREDTYAIGADPGYDWPTKDCPLDHAVTAPDRW